MGYHVVDPADLDDSPDHPCDRRSVTEALDLSNLALAVYEMEPGERLSRSYHSHQVREEAFYVLEGCLHVETPDGEFEVPVDRLFVVEPESPILPHNPDDASEVVRVLGLGAPSYDPGRRYDPDDE